MQKLVKKTRYYQTMMPVEAYHEEEKNDLQEAISIALGVGAIGVEAAVMAGLVSNPVGHTLAIGLGVASLANTDTGREVIETYGELQFDQAATEAQAGEALRELVSDANDAIMDGFIEWSSDIDYDDPNVQLYGE